MELRQLEYFVAVSEEASFTKAAARLHVAQPGVSAQVRQLEREFGQLESKTSGDDVDADIEIMNIERAILAERRSPIQRDAHR